MSERREAPERRSPGRRADDQAIHDLLASRNRMLRERVWTLRVLVVATFAALALLGYQQAIVIPELRRSIDAQVCAYRAIGAREAQLARHGSRVERRLHRRNRERILDFAKLLAGGRRVTCRDLTG